MHLEINIKTTISELMKIEGRGGGFPQQIFFRYQQDNLRIYLGQSGHDYWGISTIKSEYESSIGVKRCEGKDKIETSTRNISQKHKNIRLN